MESANPPFNLLEREHEDVSRASIRSPVNMSMMRVCISVCSVAVKYIHFTVSSVILFFMLYVANEAKKSVSEAGDILQDVSELIPEVAKSLKILTEVCKSPQFSPYCN